MHRRLLLYFVILELTISSFSLANYVIRYIDDGDVEPTNVFHNKMTFCFFSYCWNRGAKCGVGGCCTCRCNPGTTYFSQQDGCHDVPSITELTKRTGM